MRDCGGADYIGCMKNGPVYSDRNYRWFERNWPLLGDKYFTHAWGTLYVLSGRIAAQIGSIPDGALRFFSNEGTTIFAPIKLSLSSYLPSVTLRQCIRIGLSPRLRCQQKTCKVCYPCECCAEE